MTEFCENCRFYSGDGSVVGGTPRNVQGFLCLRRAPVPVVASQSLSILDAVQTRWCSVSPKWWCGEWEAAKTPPTPIEHPTATPTQKKRCAACVHVSTEYQSHYGYSYHVCRRFPPKQDQRRDSWSEGLFTRVNADWWCGEWKEADGPK